MAMEALSRFPRLVAPLDEVGMADVPEVGGKNASLGEMLRALTAKGVRVPPGFAITTESYRRFLREQGLERLVSKKLKGLDASDTAELQRRGLAIREAILAARLPEEVEEAVRASYKALCPDETCGVAVRSSATAEDLPQASFAGQQETFLNVSGRADLLDCVKRCFASLFTDRALAYRAQQGLARARVALSIGVQRMVRADRACSGVAFTLDPESGFRDVVLISSIYGLGENVVQGTVDADEHLVFKPTLRGGFAPILRRTLGRKELRLVYDTAGTKRVRNVPVPPDERARFARGTRRS